MSSRPVLWIDPGKMTGLATYVPAGFSPWHAHGWQEEYPFIGAAAAIESICGFYSDNLLVGWEHFTIGPSTHKKSADAHHAIEMIGVTRWHATDHRCTILQPAMPDERNLASPEMVKALGWWLPGKDDAQSAAQHLCAWMIRSNSLPAAEAVKLAALRDNDQER